jgi:hypothetical protein
MPEAPLPVAVIGAGYFGQFHFDAWSRIPEARLAAICVPDPETAAATAARWGHEGTPLPVFADPLAMVQAVRPAIVDIAAPPSAHLELIRAVAPFGPDIVCQKPFCDGLAGGREAVALAERHGVRIAIHENIRFQPWNRAAKRLIIAFASLALPEHHCNPKFNNSVRECYALYWALNKFKEYISGTTVVAFSDNKALTKLTNSTNCSSNDMINKWLYEISPMVKKILHRPGKLMVIPDALS